MKNMSIALITHKRINTTIAKAKALRVYLEPLITKARTNTTHSRRVVFRYLQNKEAVTELFGPVAAQVGDRPGGYLRILKTGFRKGDNAEMCIIEFVDYNEAYSAGEDGKKKKTRRRRKKGSGENTAAAETAVATETTAADVAEATESAAEDVVEDIADAADDIADEAKDA